MDNNYKDAEDLLADESFKKWLTYPESDKTGYWETWLAMRPDQKKAVQEAKLLLNSFKVEEDSIPKEESQRILAYVLQNKEPKNHIPGISQPRIFQLFPRVSPWMKVAAFVSFLVLFSSLLYLGFQGPLNLLTENKAIFATNYGEIKTIMLPDSSQVTLNSNSKLTIIASWESGKDREVWLEGEAFFDVLQKPRAAQDGQSKFVVHTDNLEVEVLGTKFNVKDRVHKTRVVLNSGKVRLNINSVDDYAPVYMVPGESVELLKQQKLKVIKGFVNPNQHSSWMNHKLLLDNTTLAELAYELKDMYGLKASFENDMVAQRVVNGTLPTDDKDALLQALSLALGVKYKEYGSDIIFME